jgi:hypothetical protein
MKIKPFSMNILLKIHSNHGLYALMFITLIAGCRKANDCDSNQIDQSRGACDVTLTEASSFVMTINGSQRLFTSNSIPNHKVGLFGSGSGSLNPNAITAQASSYGVPLQPVFAATMTPLLSTSGSGPASGPQFSFGLLLNGVELDPIAAEPFPHTRPVGPSANWEWNLEAINVKIGLDCNNAHAQPTGKYHYHGSPLNFLDSINAVPGKMTLIGYAADGFPIYYQYGHAIASDSASAIVRLTSSYQLKTGERPGNGRSAPCGLYDGVYSNDYEFVPGLGDLDEANGRTGVTLEYPSGTYYYVITDEFPSVPRYLVGSPSQDFKIGP